MIQKAVNGKKHIYRHTFVQHVGMANDNISENGMNTSEQLKKYHTRFAQGSRETNERKKKKTGVK